MMHEFLVSQVTPWMTVWLSALWRASWQGGLVILLAWLITRCWPRMPLSARTWLWRLVYLKLLVALCWSGMVTLSVLPTRVQHIALSPPAATSVPATAPAPAESSDPKETPPPPGQPQPTQTGQTPVLRAGLSQGLNLIAQAKENWLLGLGLAWLLGAAWGGIALLLAWRHTRRLLRQSRPVEDAATLAMLEELTGQAGLLWPPELLAGDIPGPLLVRAFRPVIVIPAALLAMEERGALRLVLAHELAHIRHHDLRWNWLAILTGILFFFHPIVRWCMREWQLTQEIACDAYAVEITEAPEAEYGTMLVNAAAQTARYPGQSMVAVGVSESFRMMHRRLSAMTHRRPVTRKMLLAAAMLVAALVLTTFVPWRLSAQQETRGDVQVQVLPYAEMVFPFINLPSATSEDELASDQGKLYQRLAADRHFTGGTSLRINVQKTGVTVYTTPQTPQQAAGQLAAVNTAMARVFARGSFRMPEATTIFHPVDAAMQRQTGEVLLKRMQSIGLAGSTAQLDGTDRIMLHLNGKQMDSQTIRNLLSAGRVEFRLLARDIEAGEKEDSPQTVYLSREGIEITAAEAIRTSYLVLDGSALGSGSKVQYDPNGRPRILFFVSDQTASQRFSVITGSHMHRNLAIVLDGSIFSAPVISARIADRGEISGNFDKAAAERLAAVLNAGMLPAPIRVVK